MESGDSLIRSKYHKLEMLLIDSNLLMMILSSTTAKVTGVAGQQPVRRPVFGDEDE